MASIKRLDIIANSMIEPGMSGGNKILIELGKRWQQQGVKIRVFISTTGKKICRQNGLKADYVVWPIPYQPKFNTGQLIYYYLKGLWWGIKNISQIDDKPQLIYSSSDYWPDFIPALLFKIWHRQTRWLAGFYLFAPKPWHRQSPYKGLNRLVGWLYYLMQLPAYWFIKLMADFVFVTSLPDQKHFVTNKRNKNKVVIVRGGVDLALCHSVPTVKKKSYTAIYIGRLHPQKGVWELIDIWQKVVSKLPQARLAIIGDGPERKNLKHKIKSLNLRNNIEYWGFLDGKDKIKIIRQAKIVVHPVIYDSGGMAAITAMACGLPGVSYDLPALKTYYPLGMIKTPCFDQSIFAQNIIKLATNQSVWQRYSREALKLAKTWDWDKKAKEIWQAIR